jgi:hypothetical protein
VLYVQQVLLVQEVYHRLHDHLQLPYRDLQRVIRATNGPDSRSVTIDQSSYLPGSTHRGLAAAIDDHQIDRP